MSNPLQDLKDQISRIAFKGWTRDMAHERGVCISCKKPPRFKTKLGEDEYGISGLCEYCFDEITREKE